MRILRNVSFALLVVVWSLCRPVGVRGTDLGCDGEDGFGSTPPSGPYFCGGSSNCCETSYYANADDTIPPFCASADQVADWGASGWQADIATDVECTDLVLTCACTPEPRPSR